MFLLDSCNPDDHGIIIIQGVYNNEMVVVEIEEDVVNDYNRKLKLK